MCPDISSDATACPLAAADPVGTTVAAAVAVELGCGVGLLIAEPVTGMIFSPAVS